MPAEDMAVFDEMVVVRFFTNNAFALLQRWKEWPASGRWTSGLRGTPTDRSGGSPEFAQTFLRNPQVCSRRVLQFISKIPKVSRQIYQAFLMGDIE